MKQTTLLRALMLGASFAFAGAACAQTPDLSAPESAQTPALTAAASEQKNAFIEVRHAPADFVAYWVDPAKQPMPTQLQISLTYGGTLPWQASRVTRQPGNGYGPPDLKLPAGVQILAGIAPLHRLLVRGTPAGIEALKKLVEQIDVPLQQVEVEAQIWEVAPADVQKLPLKFRGVGPAATPFGDADDVQTWQQTAMAPPTDDGAAMLQRLVGWRDVGRARLFTTPLVVAIDGLTAQLASAITRTLSFSDNPATPVNTPMTDEWQAGRASLSNEFGFTATPVLRGDLMALEFQITIDNRLTRGHITMRNGQTLAVRLPGASADNKTRIALIKARILPHANGTARVPGT